MFSTEECAWAQTSIKLLTRTIGGVLGFSAKKSIDKELLYAAGDQPIDIQTGNQKVEGSLKLLKYEVDLLNEAAQAAGYNDILEVPHTAVVVTIAFKKTAASPIRTLEVAGVAFTEMDFAMEQNAKNMPITLPLMAMKMTLKKG